MWGWGLDVGRLCLSELSVMGMWGGSWWSYQQGFGGMGGWWREEAAAGAVRGDELGAWPRAVFRVIRYGCWSFSFFLCVMN